MQLAYLSVNQPQILWLGLWILDTKMDGQKFNIPAFLVFILSALGIIIRMSSPSVHKINYHLHVFFFSYLISFHLSTNQRLQINAAFANQAVKILLKKDDSPGLLR